MRNRLSAGQALQINESLTSSNGQFSLELQDDGNLVLYDADHQPVWASGTDGQEVSGARMQQDGNLVIYSPGGDSIWASDTYGNDEAYAVLQDDRNLVIYTSDSNPVWATNTTT